MNDPKPPPIADPLDFKHRRSHIAARLFGPRPQEATKIGRYTVLRRLGAGGMAVVYAAYDESLDRRVALKLLQDPTGDNEPQRQARLEREAKAMARLSHAHVAAVYEIGTHQPDDEPPVTFIAIEYIEGETLRAWMQQDPSADAILDALGQAASGLAAAHHAGVVHRDFKPENVMVRSDGVIKVLDFGVAAWAQASDGHSLLDATTTPEDDASLTATGRSPGTPAYMAPEQLRGGNADAGADQYAFCVTAYEAFTGKRPFVAATVADLLDAMRKQPVPPAPKMPRPVFDALRRGLAFEPEARHASMEALLRAMTSTPGRRAKQVGVAAVVLGLVGAAGFGVAELNRTEPCRDGEQRLAEAWTVARQETIATAFEATALPFATTAWSNTKPQLTQWVQDWSTMRDEACTATAVHGTQSPDALDRRVACLDRAWVGFDTLATALETANTTTVIEVTDAVAGLPPLQPCADVVALLERDPLPRDPEQRAAIERVDAKATALQTKLDLGQLEDVTTAAESLVGDARQTQFPPVIARALLVAADARYDVGDEAAAIGGFKDALVEAQASGQALLMTRITMHLATAISTARDAHDAALDYLALGDGALRRAGDPQARRSKWHTARGVVLRNAGRYAESVQAYEAGLSILAADPQTPPLRIARTRAALGILSKDLGRSEEALKTLKETQVLYAQELGAAHPDTCRGQNQVASVLISLRLYDQARPLLQSSIACLEAALGPMHPDLGAPLGNYAGVLMLQGEQDKAEPMLLRVLELLRATRGPGSADEAPPLDTLGRLYLTQGRNKEAREAVTKAIEVTLDRRGPTARALAFHYHLRADIAVRDGDLEQGEADAAAVVRILDANDASDHLLGPAALLLQGKIAGLRRGESAALPLYQEAVDRFAAIHGDEPHINVALAINSVAMSQAALGDNVSARASFERALGIIEKAKGSNPTVVGACHFGLAQIAMEDKGGRAEALRLGKLAYDDFNDIGDTANAGEIASWLTRHGAPPK